MKNGNSEEQTQKHINLENENSEKDRSEKEKTEKGNSGKE